MRITKKLFDKTTQRNVMVKTASYSHSGLSRMLNAELIVSLDKDVDSENCEDLTKESLRLYLDEVKEIKIEVDEYGYLTTFAYLKENDLEVEKIAVEI